MFPIIDLIATLGGLVAAPAYDFIKKKFLTPEIDTPEATIGTLATTKPEALGEYINALVAHIKAKIDYFNRDVIGSPSQWVVDTRAVIRPAGVIAAFFILGYMVITSPIETASVLGVRASCEVMVSSWFGDRLTIH